MTIPFHRDGVSLLVTEPLLVLLNQEAVKYNFDLEQLTRLTFSFRNPDYQLQSGGVHPVEIQLIRGLDGWLFDYVTDFSYQGLGQDTELCKELDFNFLDNEHYLQGWGPLPMVDAQELFNMWQSNFLSYAELGFFTVTVSGD
ncbi:DUF2787 family protein [Aeromonas hydrophila]|uniref:DUF2787 family protein n=1 Tax=Aeromonas veronii TaxID=654 RepID=UPI000DD019EA|nr:DUF2787 family protein [Aeromonas veronii]